MQDRGKLGTYSAANHLLRWIKSILAPHLERGRYKNAAVDTLWRRMFPPTEDVSIQPMNGGDAELAPAILRVRYCSIKR